MDKDDILAILIGCFIVVVIVFSCFVFWDSDCSHDLVYCSDLEHCSDEWHLHEARCKECKNFIGNFSTGEMIKWNGVEKE